MKIIDVDGLFENFINKFLEENKGKYTAEELESKVPLLYMEFGDTAFSELSGKTPRTYFKDVESGMLTELLTEYVSKGVSVPDYLCSEIVKRGDVNSLVKLLSSDNEEVVSYALNMINEKGSDLAIDKCIEMILDDKTSEDVKSICTENLLNFPDETVEKILQVYGQNKLADNFFIEVLASSKHDDRIYDILIKEFKDSYYDLPLYCNYLVKYGDDKALDSLYERIEREDISYEDFKELKYAIESLGGEYTKQRDFIKNTIKH